MDNSQALSLNFYLRSTSLVAQDLLGKTLVRILPDGEVLAGLIVETEAYLGVTDRACHTFGDRRTSRTEPMYLEGGRSYVYLIYGMYNCFNVVSQKQGVPEAVLIRALQPTNGIEKMREFRKQKKIEHLCSGPGKLCQALQINREHNSHLLIDLPLFITEGIAVKKSQIEKAKRIGIDYDGQDAHRLLRFYLKQNRFVSKR